MTAFFVTLSRRPISLAQIPSFHHVMSAAARRSPFLCHEPLLPSNLAKKDNAFDTNREDNADSSLYNIPHTVHEEKAMLSETTGRSANETNATPWSVAEAQPAEKHGPSGHPEGGQC